MKSTTAIILGAGLGTRMHSALPKVLHKVIDKPMIFYPIEAAKSVGAGNIVIVTGYGEDILKETILFEKNFYKNVSFVHQKEPLGTGHAVKMAAEYIHNKDLILLMYGDTPLITKETLESLTEYHRKQNNDLTVVSTSMENPFGYGRIIRDGGNFIKIAEQKDGAEEELAVKEINTGLYCFNGNALNHVLENLNNNNANMEYYITDAVEILIKSGYKTGAFLCEDNEEFLGINTRAQLALATKAMQKRINNLHMKNGVTIISPELTYIGEDVEIGADTIIYPTSFIEGNTKIGESCIIGPNSTVYCSVIGNNTIVEYSKISLSVLGNSTTVGPFAHLRPNTKIGSNARVGNFTEMKNTTMGDNSKASHLSYVGDAIVGENVNLGCGIVTVNYDGAKKHETIIEDNVFVGCNVNLVAPVTLHRNSYVAAGTTITNDVPSGTLAIGRSRQQIKEDWIKPQKS